MSWPARALLCGMAWLAGMGFLVGCAARQQAVEWDFEAVRLQAEALARRAFEPARAVPKPLADLTYDQYRRIEFNPRATLWRGEGGFEIALRPGGFIHRHCVDLLEIRDGQARPVVPDEETFLFRDADVRARAGGPPCLAGFAVFYPLNHPPRTNEVANFVGASYFRALGRLEVHGASARGLAIDAALPRPEEFPHFRRYWLERPSAGARTLRLYALLDSPALTGAYQFELAPGPRTRVDVRAVLYLRHAVERLGLAPLTSMYYRGETDPARMDDFRPEIHDSDGLLLEAADGVRTWRPLRNPPQPATSVFGLNSPRGFGLLQRDRDFDHYLDLEAMYHQRPSVWVEPAGDWGAGSLYLLELPAREEGDDSVTAFWTPAVSARPGQPIELAYRMWFGPAPQERSLGAVLWTRQQPGPEPGSRRFLMEFAAWPGLAPRDEDDLPEPQVRAEGAQVARAVVKWNSFRRAWRLVFDVQPQAGGRRPVEMRAWLQRDGKTVTETWSFPWMP